MDFLRAIGRSWVKLALLSLVLVVPFVGMTFGPQSAIVAFLVLLAIALAFKFGGRFARSKKIS